MLSIIKTKKKMLETLKKIGAEEPLICVDEMDLRKMFENVIPAREYGTQTRIQGAAKMVQITLRFFTAEMKYPPKAVYIKLITSDDIQMSLLQTLQQIGQSAGEDTQCIFAYDRQPDIPEGQCRLEMLVA